MIAFIHGALVSKQPTEVWIDCGGVGYALRISLFTYGKIPDKGNIKLFTHLQIREDAHTLYGFHGIPERDLFRKLISVSGVGANTALVILSSMVPDEIVGVIQNSDVDRLKMVKGIGAKTAERIIVDLKDKLGDTLVNEGEMPNFAGSYNTVRNEALTALDVLGFSRKSSEKVVAKIVQSQPEISLEDLVKEAIKKM